MQLHQEQEQYLHGGYSPGDSHVLLILSPLHQQELHKTLVIILHRVIVVADAPSGFQIQLEELFGGGQDPSQYQCTQI